MSMTIVPIADIENMILDISNKLNTLELKLVEAVEREQMRMIQDKQEELRSTSRSLSKNREYQQVIQMNKQSGYALKPKFSL